MALLRAFPSGQLSQFYQTYKQQINWPVDPVATTVLDFDESTNAALVTDLQANWNLYTLPLVNGIAQLKKSNVPVIIAAPSQFYSLIETATAGLPNSTLANLVSLLWNGTATAAQQQKAIAFCLVVFKVNGLI